MFSRFTSYFEFLLIYLYIRQTRKNRLSFFGKIYSNSNKRRNTLKSAKRTITQYIKAIYTLTESNGGYTIICIQENMQECKTEFYRVDNITPSKRKAKNIYRLIVKHKVLGETLLDVISDLIALS